MGHVKRCDQQTGRRGAVKSAGSPRATKVFDTQREAIERGREIARNQQSELLIKVKFAVKRVSTRTVKEILELAAEHREELFEEWERSQADE